MPPETPMTLAEAARAAQQALNAAGVEDAGRDARLLTAAAAGVSTADIIGRPEQQLSAEAQARLRPMIERRSARDHAGSYSPATDPRLDGCIEVPVMHPRRVD